MRMALDGGWGRRLARAAVLALVALSIAPPGGAEEGVGPLGEKERVTRRAKLRSAAGRWITHRKRFPSRCPLCQGSGKTVARKGRRLVRVTCHQCDGQGAWLSKKDYRAAYYDMRSPDFQALPGIRDALGEQYRLASQGQPWPTKIDRYRIRSWELVDDTHGIVWFLLNASKSPVSSFWIWIPKEGATRASQGAWCLYDNRADGAWPAEPEEEAPAAPRRDDGTTWEPAGPDSARTLRTAVGAARITFRAFEFLDRGTTLRIRLKPWADPAGRLPLDRIGPDATRLLPAVLAADPRWNRVESEWRVPWHNVTGRTLLKPAWIASLSRGALEASDWDARTLEGRIQMLEWQRVEHVGWRLEAAAPAPAPAPPPTPEPEEPAPPAPEEPAPPAPPPVLPPPATPPAPPQPPPAEPEGLELPEPSAKALRDAREGVAHMREVFRRAVAAHDEGLLARKNGAYDLWQEKLSEARAHLDEVEDIWMSEVAGALPGRDEAERDAVANEHFGEIWDEIDRLKAMVRKMSAMR